MWSVPRRQTIKELIFVLIYDPIVTAALGMIQFLAASVVGRPLHYFSFGDEWFASELNEMVSLLQEANVTICNFSIFSISREA